LGTVWLHKYTVSLSISAVSKSQLNGDTK